MKYVCWLILGIVLVCAVVWPCAAFMRYRYTEMARADDRLLAAARQEEARRMLEDLKLEVAATTKGQRAYLPPRSPVVVQGLQLPAIRGAERYRYETIASYAEAGFIGGIFVLFIVVGTAGAWRQRKIDSVDREPESDAGEVVRKLVPPGTVFTAKNDSGERVEIDGTKAEVVFHNFSFVASFAGNPKRAQTTLKFSDILSVEEGSTRMRTCLTVRTTIGKVVLDETLQPFEPLGEILADMAELNRKSPDDYAAAAAREPVVRTPWYGWLILAAALAGFVLLLRHFLYPPS